MTENFDIENEKSYLKVIVSILLGLGLAMAAFTLFSAVSLVLVHFVVCDLGERGCCLFDHGVWKLSDFGTTLWNAYVNWYAVLIQEIKTGELKFLLLLPIAVPFLSILILCWVLFRSSFSLQWWYVLNNHFAKYADVCKMGVMNGKIIMLGRFGVDVLGASEPSSVFCVGETGCGKTSTIAIPSILQADKMSILAVDNSGTLARHSSGYRATLGKVFYFNWDVHDNKDKGLIYPRFNLLDEENVPKGIVARAGYVNFMAEYLINAEDKVEYDNYWNWLATSILEELINFIMTKCRQAEANDYFLRKILETSRLGGEDRDVLLSYYLLMPDVYKNDAKTYLDNETLSIEGYIPIGSWGGLPDEWQGRSVCMGMLADWLIFSYLKEKDHNNDWRVWIEKLLWEATVFSYGETIIKGMQQFLHLSKQQRQMVFAKIIRSLKVFLNANIRERTTGNDFSIADLNGRYNSDTGKLEPITIYAIANTKTTKFVNRMMVDFLLKFGVLNREDAPQCQSLMVFDDVGQMLRVKSLSESVAAGPKKGTSFLLLCNSFNNMENTYGKEVLENLIVNTQYKIIMAENSDKMSRQLDKMAIFASASVQLPKDKRRVFKAKPYFADTSYYHRLAVELKVQNKKKLTTKGYQLLLVEGYYHRPILTKNTTFMKDELFKDKASLPAMYFLDNTTITKRNVQDFDVPEVNEVLYERDLGIDDMVELDHYMNVVYDEARKQFPDGDKLETVMINDISAKWKIRKNIVVNNDNWWLEEDAFEKQTEMKSANPFVSKK